MRHRLLAAVEAPLHGLQPVVRTNTLLLTAPAGLFGWGLLLRHVAHGVAATLRGRVSRPAIAAAVCGCCGG